MLETARDTLQNLTNARGRTAGHVAVGILLCGGAMALVMASRRRHPGAERTAADLVGAMWRPVALGLALSGVRIWNAPDSPARSRALGFWSVVQGLNAALGLIASRRRSARLAAAAAGLGASAGYLSAARKVDATAAALVSPSLGLGRVAAMLPRARAVHGEPERPTLH